MNTDGVVFNMSKTEFLTPTPVDDPSAYPFKCSSDGTIMLGIPIGKETYINQKLSDITTDCLLHSDQLSKIDPKSALLMLKYAFNTRPTFFLKIIESTAKPLLASRFDGAIDKLLAQTALLQPSVRTCLKVSAVRSLPEKLGGLGMPLINGMDTDKNTMLSRRYFANYLRAYYDWIDSPTFTPTNFENHFASENSSLTNLDKKELKKMVFKAKELQREEFISKLKAEAQYEELNLFVSHSYNNSARWIRYSSYKKSSDMTDQEFSYALRIHFLTPFDVGNNSVQMICHCQSGERRIDIAANPFHFFACCMNQQLFITRHNCVRNALRDFCKSIGSNPDQQPPTTVLLEVPAPGTRRRADLFFYRSESGRQYYFDIAIVDVCAESYQSVTGDSNALEHRYLQKMNAYKDIDDGISFIPFILAASGQMAPKTLQQMENMGRSFFKSFYKTQAFADINHIVVKFGARILADCLSHVNFPSN